MRRTLTYRGQLAVMAAIHRERAEAYDRCGIVLLADGCRAIRMADCARASKHRQCVALLTEQIARLGVKP